MNRKTRKRSAASLAGWLFADLSIVLMILFASTGLTTSDLRCDNDQRQADSTKCVPPTTSTSTTLEPGAGGVRFQPIVVTVNKVLTRSSSSFQAQIEREILKQAEANPDLRTAPGWDYGVILIYGGALGRANADDGDRSADLARRKIMPNESTRWKKIRATTFIEPGHDRSVPYGSVKLKLFPIISK